ncbi:metal ABC transporter substrate-binding protein [Lachnoclostridium phytofermentans]|uniref:Periplasmic solute binding protein n=1 Tax=Lachnoclostridium phytofermentans (strain ATCC 700394 / DSM 18823 / ISDg) TaxID=357809 RepID=A9KHF8_LACP7|nr:metal ABC transporter substrate-binding protein [Lachnoclostridium phytofermentans]ABX40825.1 periplasmic solute binding protein [Lachnoclostridium phytofermentans ISDg]
MKKWNKAWYLLFFFILSVVSLTACNMKNKKEASGTLSIVCTSFPQYDFVKQIIGENPAGIEVTYLLKNGIDLHNYQASAEDMVKIRSSNLFLYIGGESEKWANEVVKQVESTDFHALALINVVQAKEEEIVEGMETEHLEGEDHEGEVQEGVEHKEEYEYDEHVWLSLKNAEVIVNEICEELSNIDSSNSEYYKNNAASYIQELKELDEQFYNFTKKTARDTILVADRFPFRYFVDDYNLRYYAAFVGCSAETEASFETIAFLAKKVEELGLPVVLIIDGSDGSIAKTVIENSKQENASVRTLNSMQSVSMENIASGASYLSIMKENLQILKEALD